MLEDHLLFSLLSRTIPCWISDIGDEGNNVKSSQTVKSNQHVRGGGGGTQPQPSQQSHERSPAFSFSFQGRFPSWLTPSFWLGPATSTAAFCPPHRSTWRLPACQFNLLGQHPPLMANTSCAAACPPHDNSAFHISHWMPLFFKSSFWGTSSQNLSKLFIQWQIAQLTAETFPAVWKILAKLTCSIFIHIQSILLFCRVKNVIFHNSEVIQGTDV